MIKYILLAFCLFPIALFAQNTSDMIPQKSVIVKDTANETDLIDLAKDLFNISPGKLRQQHGKRVYFSILPVASSNGGGGNALVTSTTAGMYLGDIKTTNISSASFAPYWNFGKRFGLPLRSSIWLPDNTWTLQGDLRFLHYPQNTWGLGSANSNLDYTLVNYNYIRFYENALKKIEPYLFAGFGYDMDFHSSIRSADATTNLRNFTNYAYGTNGSSTSSGITLNLLYDTRNNSINPLPGAYANIVYRINPVFLGSNNTWSSIYIDMRKYFAMNPSNPTQQNTLAFWSYFWSVLNNKTPYLDLPSINWDPYNRSGRGIEQNRYRGKTLFYFESEYRRDITDNGLLGFVLFANINTVGGSNTLFTSWHPAAGPGLRLKFNKNSNTNLGMDYGVSKGYSAIIFNIGETF